MPKLADKIDAITAPRGLKMPREYYAPLPDFLPCMSHGEHDGFDLYAFYYRDTLHTNSYTTENPWLDEAAQLDPFSYTVAINAATARRKGLADGQAVWLETESGRRVKGQLKCTQAVHPEGIGIGGCHGHWGEGMPVAKDKGVFFNGLLDLDWEHCSPVNLNLDLCARVKLTPVAEGRS
jgi:molybdopterin-containing oxidoreductase family molybdopterin binding subunit